MAEAKGNGEIRLGVGKRERVAVQIVVGSITMKVDEYLRRSLPNTHVFNSSLRILRPP
jgi:hypothetical protein